MQWSEVGGYLVECGAHGCLLAGDSGDLDRRPEPGIEPELGASGLVVLADEAAPGADEHILIHT